MRDRWPSKQKERNPIKSEALDILACEKMVMNYLDNKNNEETNEFESITKESLYDFWKYIQWRKEALKGKWEA